MLLKVGGDAASNVQFYITDRESHFLNGSLYFKQSPNADSLQPVIDFVRADMEHLLASFRWKESE